MERKRFVYCLLIVHKGKAKSKHPQNMPNFVTSASPPPPSPGPPPPPPRPPPPPPPPPPARCRPTTPPCPTPPGCPAAPPLFAGIFKLGMVEISRGRKLVRKNQSCTQIVLPFTDVRWNGCRNREATDF